MIEPNVKIPVFGMKCQKCVGRVTQLIQSFPEVDSVVVGLDSKDATLSPASATPIPIDRIIEVLHQAGFTTVANEAGETVTTVATEVQQFEQLRFSISGMSCVSCAATIEKQLKKLPGVDNVNVNLAANFAQIDYAPQQVSKETIFAAVDKAGFGVVKDQQLDNLDESKQELRLVLIAAAGALPIMLLMLVPVFGQATVLINGLLATIVQFTAGLGFYSSAWKSLHNRSANMDVLVSLGITAAYGYSVLAVSGLLGSNPTVFFETSAMLI
ncbi:MAG: cation-translocating P-type ATPase, partial [Desulfuromonadales bacterium]|nr:cation-translocating P-type ATPase [Desulfuromonadales bacterium]